MHHATQVCHPANWFTRTAIFIALHQSIGWASMVSIRASRVNDTPVVPMSSIMIVPGDTVECDFWISGWGADLELLASYELRIDSVSLVTGESGVLRPYSYDGPMPLFNACSSDDDCIEFAHCGTILCLPPACPIEGCPPGQHCGSAGWCFDSRDYPLNGSREVGVSIDTQRPDFAFFDLKPLALVDISPSPGIRWGAISLLVRGIEDPEIEKYAGSAVLTASSEGSSDGEACGTFFVSCLPHPETTFFCEPPTGPDIPCFAVIPEIIPFAVNVDCSGVEALPSECNRDRLVTIAEHRHLTDCFDGTALEGTCFCLDNNDDGQVDMRDFADLQNLFDGAGKQ